MSGTAEIIGKSKHAEQLRRIATKLAAGNQDVLIIGEPGVGKSVLAAGIANGKHVVTLNLVPLDEAEVRVALAHIQTGVVVLKGVDESGFRTQAEVWSFVNRRSTGVRVIVTLRRSIKELLKHNKLTHELVGQLASFEVVEVKPLRERPEDIPLLVKSFAKGLAIDINTLETLVNLPWKENIRQLRSIVERCLSSAEGGRFVLPQELIDDRTEIVRAVSGLVDSTKPVLEKSLDTIENNIIQRTLARFGFNTSKAAEFLGMTEEAFDQKVRRIVAVESDSH